MKIQIAVAALLFVPSLAVLAVGCQYALGPAGWPLSCDRAQDDSTCATCIKASCCTEATACSGDAHCECLNRCHKYETYFAAQGRPEDATDVYACMKGCRSSERTNPPFAAFAACVDAHCQTACAAPGGSADAGPAQPKGTISP